MTSGFEVWDKIFDSLPVLQEVRSNGNFYITSKDLNQISNRLKGPDARNLVKYDHVSMLPPILRKNRLSLLPVGRGEFLLGPHKIYAHLDDRNLCPIKQLRFPSELETLQRISSETDALMVAFHGQAISEVLGEPVQLTGGGKEGGPGFDMVVEQIGGHKQEVHIKKGVSIEIDGTYEGASLIGVFEAKLKSVVDFNVRQLYFPLRSMAARLSKPVRTVFLTYANEVFDIREFKFLEFTNISSFVEVSRFRYSTAKSPILQSDLDTLATENLSAKEPPDKTPPFPQADSLDRLINLVENLVQKPRSKSELADEFGFDERQSDYYGNAASFLGLASRIEQGKWGATKLAEKIFALQFRERNLEIANLVLAHDVFRLAYLKAREDGEIPSSDRLLDILRSSPLSSKMSGSTPPRRVGTIKGWVRWLLTIAEE